MPIIRRYVRLNANEAILARIFINSSDVSFFTPDKLDSVFRAIRPLVYRRLRVQRAEKGVSVTRAVVGDRGDRDLQQTILSDQSGSAVVRENAVGGGTGDVIVLRDEGWQCSLFLVKDQGKSSAIVVRELQLVPRRKRKRTDPENGVIDLDDAHEFPDDDAVPEEGDDSEEDDDVKPEVRTNYSGFDIYGKALYLVLRKLRGNAVAATAEVQEDDQADDGGMIGWISASQMMPPSDAVDFEAR